MSDYESPAKQELRESLAKMAYFASPQIRKIVEDAIANIIETIIVCHGLIQYALRGLSVLAWQRSREAPLTEEDLKPFWDHIWTPPSKT